MRAFDQDTGFRVYTERLVDAMLRIDHDNQYLLLYRSGKWLGRFGEVDNVKEVLIGPSHKLYWDQIAVPYTAWKENADVVFNPKFSIPLISHCPVTMGLQEPAWWAWPEHHPWWDVLYMRIMLPLYCRKSAHIFPMSQFILEENRKYLKLPLENTSVAYTAANLHFGLIDDAQVLKDFRAKYDLPEKYILSVTRVENIGNEETTFCSTKNVETTVRAYTLCRDKIPHMLVIAGRRIREYLIHSGWKDEELGDIRFLDFVPHEEITKLYNLADLFILPSFYEGCPHILIEAMACGCPIVSSNAGPCPEVADGAALFADPNKPEEFAEKIRSVLTNEKFRRELQQKSLERALFFNFERTARVVLAGLIEAVNNSKR